ncbi:hypothetical protein NEF87_001384 [Candidatus Lokiarchaeum ossiferum]|uniref:Uncharacterized protein n=1 Tax=Candidatus Lokiarchaeum ossiferum TaxID=2951803 RepID=A0ABY6HNL0_9ARCH|nr:hypothetical protein NEF87_001384 [Candidatus Lokiarchaeum sp. B-35]
MDVKILNKYITSKPKLMGNLILEQLIINTSLIEPYFSLILIILTFNNLEEQI